MTRRSGQACPFNRVELVSIFLECEEDTRDFLMRLRGSMTPSKGDVAEFANLPLHPRLPALTAREAPCLGSSSWLKAPVGPIMAQDGLMMGPCSAQPNDVGVAQNFSKNVGNRKDFISPEMMGVVCGMP